MKGEVVASAKPGAAARRPPAAEALAAPRPQIDKHVKQPTAHQLAEEEYRKATAALHQGRVADARHEFEAALQSYPAHQGARQALLGLLLEAKNTAEAERVLQEGVKLNPGNVGFIMALARVQVERQDVAAAIDTLQKGLPHAQGHPEYAAFLAALLQRQGRHAEAIEQFQTALRLKPRSGVWLLGLGISLQATNRIAEAQEAFQRARATDGLNPELRAFVDQRLRQLQ
ncbi:MAG: tetratricopeptide repeat protein [Betaproteobacteria bacterium]|nr:tetratricopeptide repeat protein [Betaproteobacteria bacterium]